MFRSFPVGHVHGIGVFLHPSLLLLLPMGLSQGAEGFALLVAIFGCVFLHELGHALMASAYGIRTRSITLYPIGGVAALERMPRSAGPELLVALAGPAVNFVLAGVLGVLLGMARYILGLGENHFLTMMLFANLGLGLFNLLPVFPMDGGRVLRALLSGPLGRVRATVIAAGVGQMLAIVGGTLFLLNGMVLSAALCLFVFLAAASERADVLTEEARRHRASTWTSGSVLWPHPFRPVSPVRVRVVEPRAGRTWR